MPAARKVLIIDEGELDLVAALLTDLRIPHVRERGSKLKPPVDLPSRLLVTTSALAKTLKLTRERRPQQTGEDEPALWLAFVEGNPRSERTAMRAAGFDFTVPQQVHPAALRLLLARPFYNGVYEGASPRVSVGREVKYTSGMRRRPAVLIDLSVSGCRILTRTSPRVDSRITLQLPLDDGSRVHVTGKVVRISPGQCEGGASDEVSVAVRFAPSKSADRKDGILAVMRDYKVGPAQYTAGEHESARRLARAARIDGHAYARKPRATYTREIALLGTRESGMLVGRDLSEEGVRVARHPSLRVGMTVKIAVHGEAREEPLILSAKVTRDDGRRGFLLRFLGLDGVDRERLRGMLHNLPPLGHFDDDTATHTAILAQIVSSLKKR